MGLEKKYKASCITSIFEASEWMEGFLDDITRQSIFEEIEFILINANSPEKEEEEKVINDYLKGRDNIRYETLQEDPGVYEVWNIGVKKSKSEYLSNWNVDDKRDPEHIEKHIKCLNENPEVDLVYSNVLMTCTKEDTYENNNAVASYDMPEFSYENLLKCNMPHNCPVWRKSLHERYGYFRTDMVSAADFDFWLRAASDGSKFMGIDETLGLYYKNPRGISTKQETLSKAIEEVNELRAKYSGLADYRNFVMK